MKIESVLPRALYNPKMLLKPHGEAANPDEDRYAKWFSDPKYPLSAVEVAAQYETLSISQNLRLYGLLSLLEVMKAFQIVQQMT